MNNGGLHLQSHRARKARLAKTFNNGVSTFLIFVAALLVLIAIYALTLGDLQKVGYFSLSIVSLLSVLLLWHHYDLKTIPFRQPMQQPDDVIEAELLALLKEPLNPQAMWDIATNRPEGIFICNRLLMHPELQKASISTDPVHMQALWMECVKLTTMRRTPEIHAGIIVAAIILNTPGIQEWLVASKLGQQDVLESLDWLDRQLQYIRQPKPYFGGIGRDWASGFTPTLEHFGQNISQAVESGHTVGYLVHDDLLPGIASSLAQGNGVALVGAAGTGKTTLVNGLAEYLLEGKDQRLQYYKIVTLNASLILSNSGGNHLENLMLTLFGEAATAGNIIIFLDDANLFFGSGVGAFDMSQVLLPILRNRSIKIIAAFTPAEWQSLQAQRSALASSFASITISEPPEAATMKVAEDIGLNLEHRSNTLVSYEAVREAYRLSGQFMQERSYPGKVLSLLEQALPYAENGKIMTAASVQTAIEKTKGIKVAAAQAPEADMLLHMEDRIHERMINQKRAVNVVAAALRRGRAGVTNPKRPLGSFLFLGPTGVGKTELARSLAAVYFGSEQQMIRLDMSEYQRPEDVSRLLATGGQNQQSLLLAIRQQPFAVVLLDEIEKAHPNILNLLLQMLDEGQLTDEQGRPASFRSAIIIATSNAGAADIAARVQQGLALDDFERPLIDKLIAAGQFKPELVNRFDEVVLFRPLNEEELSQVAQVMLKGVNETLAPQHISVQLTPEALKIIVHAGYDPEFGARPMRRIIQKTVENAIAVKILQGQAQPGSVITLDVADVTPTNNTPQE
ncbi:MAG TPA: AAA family ATPase [Candidatus Saccharimonadales bacterium]|nr:AAA family ATPase [Candidatus Saccharimonadales bacterium]